MKKNCTGVPMLHKVRTSLRITHRETTDSGIGAWNSSPATDFVTQPKLFFLVKFPHLQKPHKPPHYNMAKRIKPAIHIKKNSVVPGTQYVFIKKLATCLNTTPITYLLLKSVK